MNLIKQISLDLNCKYFEDKVKLFHTPDGALKSQKIYCVYQHNKN